MPEPHHIQAQQRLLEAHRQTLATLLEQKAHHSISVPPSITNGISEARREIRRIKETLRGWGVALEDLPDDSDSDQPPAPAAPKPRRRVFLSYKRDLAPDDPLAQRLVEALRPHHDVFVDRDLPVGVPWAERIQAELARADALIVLLSARASESEMVREEVTLAHTLARQTGRPTILPVRLDFHSPFTYPLSAYLNPLNWARWDSQRDTPALIAALLRALDGAALPLREPPSAPAPPEALPAPVPAAQPHLTAAAAPALELPEGTMDGDSAFYIARKDDPAALEAVRRPGVTLTIKGPRQMGKSSLLLRAAAAAQQAGKRVAFLDFQLFDRATLAQPDAFFRQFCVWLSDTLDLDDRTAEHWQLPLGNPQRCTRYLSRYVLKEVGAPLLLAMDEVETLFDTTFRSDFFGMLRSWHNSRATDPRWKRLDLALVTSTEPYQLIDNLNQSPFNVGLVLDLEDFTLAQVADLNARHAAPLDPRGLERLHALLGGHPYLVRRALYLLAAGRLSAAKLFAHAAEERGPFGDHLRYHLFRLHGRPELVAAMLQVLRAQTCPDETLFFRLRGAGLVRREGPASVPRCALYADYFRAHLRVL